MVVFYTRISKMLFSFKGSHFWRTKQDMSLVSPRPARTQNFWIGLPPGTNKIDAVYERKSDSRIVFFIGGKQKQCVVLGCVILTAEGVNMIHKCDVISVIVGVLLSCVKVRPNEWVFSLRLKAESLKVLVLRCGTAKPEDLRGGPAS